MFQKVHFSNHVAKPHQYSPHIIVEEDGSITAAQAFGEEWLKQKRSAILSAPSAVIEIERNFVLNPTHADFANIAIDATSKLDLDPRLWSTALK